MIFTIQSHIVFFRNRAPSNFNCFQHHVSRRSMPIIFSIPHGGASTQNQPKNWPLVRSMGVKIAQGHTQIKWLLYCTPLIWSTMWNSFVGQLVNASYPFCWSFEPGLATQIAWLYTPMWGDTLGFPLSWPSTWGTKDVIHHPMIVVPKFDPDPIV